MTRPAGPELAEVRRRLAGRPRRVLTGPTHAFASPAAAPAPSVAAASPEDWNDELPGTGLEIVIELDGGWDLELAGRPTATQAFASGLLVGRVRTRARGGVRLVQLSIDPLAAPALFGVPAGELAGTAVDLDALMGPAAERIRDRIDARWLPCGRGDDIGAGPTGRMEPDPAVAATEAWVAGAVRQADDRTRAAVPADVVRACDLLRACRGTLRIDALARELGCSRRHLARRFATFLGVSPSEFNRLLRFEQATAALRRDPARPLGRLALDAGYADHPHMDREFAALAGASPSAVAQRFA